MKGGKALNLVWPFLAECGMRWRTGLIINSNLQWIDARFFQQSCNLLSLNLPPLGFLVCPSIPCIALGPCACKTTEDERSHCQITLPKDALFTLHECPGALTVGLVCRFLSPASDANPLATHFCTLKSSLAFLYSCRVVTDGSGS